jgi:integrase
MVHQSCSYLKLKGSTYYFSRRVPKPLQKHFKTDRVEVCLHTPQQSSAVRQAQVLASELEDHWYILRRREIKHRLSSLFGDGSDDMRQTASVTGVGPQLSAALEVYLSLKGAGRPKTFEAGARRAVGYLLEVTDDKPIDAYVRADANAFREFLRSRGLSSESIRRNLTSIRAIVNFVSKEEGLQPPLAFSGVYLGEPTGKADRYVPTTAELRSLQAHCRSSNDELRWLLALISDTGLRLSEALGLSCDDVCLNTPHPYVVIEPKLWRRLKTADSERVVPLVGEALWAVQRATAASAASYLFASYCDGETTKVNSASAALNKWLKAHVSRDVVVHSLRHAMRDRLRAVECPTDIIDQIGGWSRKGVGESYGRGYQVEQLWRWMAKVVG